MRRNRFLLEFYKIRQIRLTFRLEKERKEEKGGKGISTEYLISDKVKLVFYIKLKCTDKRLNDGSVK